MRQEILGLAISQFREFCEPFQSSVHQDKRKVEFKKNLFDVSNSFFRFNITHLPKDSVSIGNIYNDLNFFRNWAIALDSRNGYTLSKEMRCLMEDLCAQWIPDPDKYIFAVTDGDFAINRYSSTWPVLLAEIKKVYHVDFKHQLVSFYIPKHLYEDFLFISTIYHEMGHFVVSYYNMDDVPTQKIIEMLDSNTAEANDIKNVWFCGINECYDASDVLVDKDKRDEIVSSYIQEYMADLFASQYVGVHVGNHRESLQHDKMDVFSASHPSSNKRMDLINEFLKYQYDPACKDPKSFLLSLFDNEFSSIKRDLRIISKPIDTNNLLTGTSIKLHSSEELHSLLFNACNLYLDNVKAKTDVSGRNIPETANYSIYHNINKGIKNTIKEYFGL